MNWKKIIFYAVVLLTIVFALIPFFFFSVYELDYSFELVYKYILVLIILSLIFSWVTSDLIINTKRFKNKWRNLGMVALDKFLAFILTIMFSLAMLSGMLICYNSFFGHQEKVDINTSVIKAEIAHSTKGRASYYITINIPNENREVELKVDRPYTVGEKYTTELYKGSLGMYYKKK